MVDSDWGPRGMFILLLVVTVIALGAVSGEEEIAMFLLTFVSLILIISGGVLISWEIKDLAQIFWGKITHTMGLTPHSSVQQMFELPKVILGLVFCCVGLFIFLHSLNIWIFSRLTTFTVEELILNWLSLLIAVALGLLLPAGVLCWIIGSNLALSANLTEDIADKVMSVIMVVANEAINTALSGAKLPQKILADVKFERYAWPYVKFGKAVVGFTVYGYVLGLGLVFWLRLSGLESLTLERHGWHIAAILAVSGIVCMIYTDVKQLIGAAIIVLALVCAIELLHKPGSNRNTFSKPTKTSAVMTTSGDSCCYYS